MLEMLSKLYFPQGKIETLFVWWSVFIKYNSKVVTHKKQHKTIFGSFAGMSTKKLFNR